MEASAFTIDQVFLEVVSGLVRKGRAVSCPAFVVVCLLFTVRALTKQSAQVESSYLSVTEAFPQLCLAHVQSTERITEDPFFPSISQDLQGTPETPFNTGQVAHGLSTPINDRQGHQSSSQTRLGHIPGRSFYCRPLQVTKHSFQDSKGTSPTKSILGLRSLSQEPRKWLRRQTPHASKRVPTMTGMNLCSPSLVLNSCWEAATQPEKTLPRPVRIQLEPQA